MPNHTKKTKKAEGGSNLSDFYVYEGEGENRQLTGILNPDGSGEYLIGGPGKSSRKSRGGRGSKEDNTTKTTRTLKTDDEARIKALAAGTGYFSNPDRYEESKVSFLYGKRGGRGAKSGGGYYTSKDGVENIDKYYREGMDITGFRDAKGNVYRLKDIKADSANDYKNILRNVGLDIEANKKSLARRKLERQAAQEYIAGKGKFTKKKAKGSIIGKDGATADREDTSYESGYGGHNLNYEDYIKYKQKDFAKRGVGEYKPASQAGNDQSRFLQNMRDVYDFEKYKPISADKFKPEYLRSGEAFGDDDPYVPVTSPVKKVSKPIKQGFSMTPKDHALGKFSYAAIQAKKAGQKSFEYAGKTFPVKKGSMYGSSNKAIYKAKMPAIFKMGVKGLNKLDK
tara:strand:+ start:1198 stop:2388 length:1191 start_codon:yes stop_codon:yes gene_type:complete